MWIGTKVHLRQNTREDYEYMYNTYVRSCLGRNYLTEITTAQIKQHYNSLIVNRCIKVETVAHIQNIVYQVFQSAKEIRLSKKANFTITVTVTIILLVLLLVTMFVMFGVLVRRNSVDRYSIYMVGDHKHRSYHDDIPLKIEDLTDTDSEYSYTLEKSGDSVIMNLVAANQTPHLNSGEHMQMKPISSMTVMRNRYSLYSVTAEL
jgi:hypothetical protein